MQSTRGPAARHGATGLATPLGGAFLVGVLMCGLAGCDRLGVDADTGNAAELDHEALRPALVRGELLNGSDILGLPTRIRLVEDHLVVLDAATDPAVHVFLAEDGSHVRSFGRRGEGPGEFVTAWSIDAAPAEPGAFWIYDIALRRVTRAGLSGGRTYVEGPATDSIVQLMAEATLLDPLRADSLLVSLGFFPDGRLGHFDRQGRQLRTVGGAPGPETGAAAHVLQHAYQSSLAANASRTLFAVATRHADRLELYTLDGVPVGQGNPPFGFSPPFTVRERGGVPVLATGPDLRFGYLDVVARESHVYALFSGRTRRGFPGRANFGAYVHVYAWDGSLVRVYELDTDALSLTVERDGSRLYVLRHHPSPGVIRYELTHETAGLRGEPVEGWRY